MIIEKMKKERKITYFTIEDIKKDEENLYTLEKFTDAYYFSIKGRGFEQGVAAIEFENNDIISISKIAEASFRKEKFTKSDKKLAIKLV